MKTKLILVLTAFTTLFSEASGTKSNAPRTLEEQYESLVQESFVITLAINPSAAKQMGMSTADMMTNAMVKFRKLDPSKQIKSYEDLRRIFAVGGLYLVQSIIQENMKRKSAGLDAVWPKADGQQTTATAYFRMLFDVKHVGKAEWSPLVKSPTNGNLQDLAFDKATGKSKWFVAKGVTDTLMDTVPVLVSSNVDPTSLVTKEGAHKVSTLKGKLRFTGDFAIIVSKNGKPKLIDHKNDDLTNIYKTTPKTFTLPKGFGYLAP